jgi:hypothetical protein
MHSFSYIIGYIFWDKEFVNKKNTKKNTNKIEFIYSEKFF